MAKSTGKSWYKEGVVQISKSRAPISFRSGWEYEFALLLEEDKTVVSVEYETLQIPYISNKRSQKRKIYIPDFLVQYTDGTKKVIEIKRTDRVNSKLVQTKKQAAEAYLNSLNPPIAYELWSKIELTNYRKIIEASIGKKVSIPKLKSRSKKRKSHSKTLSVKKVKKKVATDILLSSQQRLLLETHKKCKTKSKVKK
jgi:hypothetical protein